VSKWVLKFLQGDNGSVGGGAASSQAGYTLFLDSIFSFLSGPRAYDDSMSFYFTKF
jgi:hypothetical protein